MYIANRDDGGDIPVYNYVSDTKNPITWKQFHDLGYRYGQYWPTIHAVWYYFFIYCNNVVAFTITNFLFHTCFGYIMDGLAVVTGRKPM